MFNFPHTDHRKYKKNFLKTVIFQIAFEESTMLVDKKAKIVEIFNKVFPRVNDKVTKGIQISFKNDQTPILQQIENNKTGVSIEMRSNDGQRVLSIDNTSLSYTIGGKSYTSFDDLKMDLVLLNSFFGLSEIKKVKRIAIRKINIIDFVVNTNASDFLAHLVSSELLSNLNYFPDTQFIRQNIQSISYQKDDFTLNIKYGLNIPKTIDKEIGQIILDIDLFNTSQIDSNNTIRVAEEINNEIFNIFNWAISDNTKNLLDGHD
jgi:uncharacterized protein (TIGR04255 family)